MSSQLLLTAIVSRLISVPLFLMAIAFNCQANGDDPPWAAPPIDRSVSIRNGKTGNVLTWKEMAAELTAADVVFLGETHLDETTHLFELAVLESLIAARGDKVVLSMEMFERDVQPRLDAYLKGEISEKEFLATSRPWSNYQAAYRPLVEAARQAKIPVVAANFPTPLRRRIAMEGKKVLDEIRKENPGLVPQKLIPNTPAYWKRVDNAVRGHLAMMRAGANQDDQRLLSTQTLWDNAMGEACALALDAHPGSVVVHVNGGFHTAYWKGTARQLALRKPDARIKTISIVPSANPSIEELKGVPTADFVVFASEIASDINEGKYSVHTSLEHGYRLSFPKRDSADGGNARSVPLLIWLGDEGLEAKHGLELWQQLISDSAAIAVLEPRYKERQFDLSVGGRWYWPESFSEDIAATELAVERTWGYLLRHFPIDPDRVCIAGEGEGATVAAAIALRTRTMPIKAVAWHPRKFAKLKDFPLLLPEYFGNDVPPDRSLTVFGRNDSESFWTSELEAYSPSHIAGRFATVANDPWEARNQWLASIRDAIGVEPETQNNRPKGYIVIPEDSPSARHWARLQALWCKDFDAVALAEPPQSGDATELTLSIEPDEFAQPGSLPLCPGPFGGTTVLVLPDGLSDAARSAWMELEANDPIGQVHRFHRLRVATAGEGEKSLPAVLANLQQENRKNVLIVPAEFCAGANAMQSLKRTVAPFDDSMTLHWLPGLGGQRSVATPK